MADSTNKSAGEITHRLPTNVKPTHYQLYIDASQLEKYIFQGTIDIDLKVEYRKNKKKFVKDEFLSR